MSKEREIIFIIPNNDIGGSQNFLKRLFNNIQIKNKSFFVEDLVSFGAFNFFNRVFSIYKKVKATSKKVAIITTVNSMIPSSVCKLIFNNFFLISRLGNTLSAETKSNNFQSFKLIFLHKFIFSVSDLIVFQSHSMKKDALEVLGIKDSDKYVVINNGIDFFEISEKAKQESTDIVNADYFNFILLGSFKYQKAYDIFLEAIKLTEIDLLSKMRFYICGDNAFNDKIFEEFVEGLNESGLSQYVNLMGWIRNPYPLMKSMDAYILPSRYEGFPNSLIEALALGLPSIVSRSPGANEEIVTDGFNGLTFENENASDLSKQILSLRNQIESFDSTEIINDIKKRYEINNMANRYKELLV